MKKINFKAGFSFGIGVTVFFIIQHIWTSDIITVKIVVKSVIAGLISGAFSVFFYAVIMRIFKAPKFVVTSTKIDAQPNDEIIFQTSAKHLKDVEGEVS